MTHNCLPSILTIPKSEFLSNNYDCSGGDCLKACSSDADCATGKKCLVTIDNVDTGVPGGNGYPCRDQNGWGMDIGTTGKQTLSPVYWWNNTDETSGNPSYMTNYYSQFQEDRDFCYHSPVTNCGAKSGWNYTAYTYPHPLQGAGDTTPPAAPSGVRVS